ncbi:uncharacterized protein LOC131931251 [Physella acuta]|uniref:uncharacterized protein LOC131931251 n=1 Tax=Physella acuta TaxID=109671 RepID=UPI0027DD76A9|nr:uncharacterized protein LOC131931251 [Physella acuta]
MYNFSIVKDNHKNGPTSTADIDLLPAIISGALAGLVIVGLVILLIVKRKSLRRMFSKTRCFVFCKKKKDLYEGSTNNEGREMSNTYMNIAVNTDTTLKFRQRHDYDEIDLVTQENNNSNYEQFSVAPKSHYHNVTIGSSI